MTLQICKMAWNAVVSNKLRTFLTMLGIIIGVAALVVLVSIADGASQSVSDQVAGIGTNYLTVRISDDKDKPLKLTEFAELLEQNEELEAAPIASTSVTGKSGYTSGSCRIYGTTGSYFGIMGQELQQGRNLKWTDAENRSHVVVITADTAIEFFGHTNVIDERISLNGKSFQIVGVVDNSSGMTVSSSSILDLASSSDSSDSAEETVDLKGYIPYSALSGITDNVSGISQFYVALTDQDSAQQTEATVTGLMMERLGQDSDAFTVQNQSDVMEAMTEVDNTLTLMLGGIAAISLLVGGIGIMNIMMVSVTERTREIGIRKAIGAGRGSIMAQFMAEALIVSMTGCIAGIGISWVILRIAEQLLGGSMSLHMEGQVVMLAAVFSGVIGVIFGLYPAYQAARKKPIEALRF